MFVSFTLFQGVFGGVNNGSGYGGLGFICNGYAYTRKTFTYSSGYASGMTSSLMKTMDEPDIVHTFVTCSMMLTIDIIPHDHHDWV